MAMNRLDLSVMLDCNDWEIEALLYERNLIKPESEFLDLIDWMYISAIPNLDINFVRNFSGNLNWYLVSSIMI